MNFRPSCRPPYSFPPYSFSCRVSRVAHLFVGAGFGCFVGATVSIVLTIDAQYVEVCGQSLDLAQEVFGSEASFAEFLGKRVGGRREIHAGVDELAEQGRHQHGVPRIIEFELVEHPITMVERHELLELVAAHVLVDTLHGIRDAACGATSLEGSEKDDAMQHIVWQGE